MAKYVYLDQTIDSLPLIDKELIYADVDTIMYTTAHTELILKNLDNKSRSQAQFFISTDEKGCYPRFNVDDWMYNISPDPYITPVVDLKHVSNLDFNLITDTQSFRLRLLLEYYKNVYVFWSGGIDSTLVLAAILKHWTKDELEQLIIICNEKSIAENPLFYNKYIYNKLKTVSTDQFYKNETKFEQHSLYVSSEVADALIAYSEIKEFDQAYPGLYKQSYKKHSKEIIQYWGDDRFARDSYSILIKSLDKNNIQVDTVYDLLWWINFNWGFDLEVYYMLWQYSLLPEGFPAQQFLTRNVFDWYKIKEYQQWSISAIGTQQKIRDTITTNKYAYKKYIYDFDKNLDYFLYKEKEPSTPRNKHLHHGKKVVAVDVDWNIYYR